MNLSQETTKDMASILSASTKRAEKAIADNHTVVDADFREVDGE